MGKKGKYTAADAMRNGLVPAAPFSRIIDRWAAENWWLDEHAEEQQIKGHIGSTRSLADFCGVSLDLITRLRRGTKDWIEFDNADRIVTYIDPFLWRTDPELSAIYQEFDFANLDFTRPTCEATDVLLVLDSVSARSISAVTGVQKETVSMRRSVRGLKKAPSRAAALAA